MRRRRRLWLLAALALFGIAGYLLLRSDGPKPPPIERPEIPHRLRPAEVTRMERRAVLPALPPAKAAAEPEAPQRPRDPMLAALAFGKGSSAVVFEANALRYSPIGQLLLDCLASRGQDNPLQLLKDKYGIDALQNLDRVAITPHGVLLTGDFKSAKWDDLFQHASGSAYGDQARMYELDRPGPDGGVGQSPLTSAVWDDQLVYVGQSEEDARAAIDRVEGRAPSEPLLTENQTYGEVYGVLGMEQFKDLFPPEQAALAQKFAAAAQQVELHVDARSDVGIQASIKGADPQQVEDLGRSLAGMLSAARLEAKAKGEDQLAQLLDFARVNPDGNAFSLEMALPLDYLKQQLAWCHADAGTP